MKKALQNGILIFCIALVIRLGVLALIVFVSGKTVEQLSLWFDGASYQTIAQSFPLPYGGEAIEHFRHYPLFPFIIYIVTVVIKNSVISSYLTVICASALSVVIFYYIAQQFSAAPFLLACIFAVFPEKWLSTSIFIYSEPVFMLFFLAGILCYVKKEYRYGALFIGLSCLARPVGIFFAALFFLWQRKEQQRCLKEQFWAGVLLFIPFVVFVLYLKYRFSPGPADIQAMPSSGGLVTMPAQGIQVLFPFVPLWQGLCDHSVLFLRKIYSTSICLLYTVVAGKMVFDAVREKTITFLQVWYIPYYLFIVSVQGNVPGDWLVAAPRFFLPIAPAGIVYICRNWNRRLLVSFLTAAFVLGVIFSLAVVEMHQGRYHVV